jgi:5-methylcytosine-specific restriction endonuclease McrA
MPFCRNVVMGAGRCPEHRRGGTAGTPGYGYAWRRVRDPYIKQHPNCERCGKPAIDVHHIDGQHPSEPGANDWTRLEALCRSCHRRETERMKKAKR